MTECQWAVRAEGLSKKFGLTLSKSMKYGLRDAVRRLMGHPQGSDDLREGEFWAVRDVSFDLMEGEALGIMGVNGSGKTTLLRILNGVYAPDSGRVQLRGRVGALIAAGAGFAPMLSGRENVYVNGALLGLSTREIDDLMDEIIAFSELGDFIDLPVRNYSSGMYVRLGFAIAALSKPDVLLMDEILAVGDLNFQKKCYDHILELKRKGTAIVLVSHAPGAIWAVCDRGLFMDHGHVLAYGRVEDVIRAYDDQNSRNAKNSESMFAVATGERGKRAAKDGKPVPKEVEDLKSDYGHGKGGTGDAVCLSVVVQTKDGVESDTISFGDPFYLEFRYKVFARINAPIFRCSFDAIHYKFIVSVDSYEQGMSWDHIEPGEYTVRVLIKEQTLRPGAYRINTSIVSKFIGIHIFYWFSAATFIIAHPSDRFLYSNDKAVVFFPCDYTLESTP